MREHPVMLTNASCGIRSFAPLPPVALNGLEERHDASSWSPNH
jgi:hypothetical protein